MSAATASFEQVNTLATHTALSAWAWAGDFLIVIVLFAALFLFAWYVGKGQLVALLMSLYAAYALYVLFPYTSLLPTAPASTALACLVGLYAALTLAVYIVLRRIVVSDFLYIGIIGIAVLALLGACFILALAYQVFPVHTVYTFSPAIDVFFAPKNWFFYWFVAPLIGLIFLAR
ncbi:MAG TPA: hypothetical protein VM103_01830 [Candidatus Paceibacterota bacterium]|nr:hypothetical protein [Candidatus Paceibacterota bacterium]